MKKTLKWTALVVVLLVIAGVVTLFLSLNGIIRSTVEKESADQLKLATALERANLSLMGGNLKLDNYAIGSPPGFKAEKMLSFDDLDVSVSWSALNDNPVHVKSISIKKPRLVLEHQNGKMNFKAAMDQITPPGTPPADEKDAMKLIIDDLTIEEAQVVVRPGIPGLAEEYPITVPSVTLKNIGTGEGAENGAAVKEVAMQVITVLAAEASNSGKLPAELQAVLNGDLASVASRLSEEAQKQIVKAIPGELGETLGAFLDDPEALMKDPGKVIGSKVGDVTGEVKGRLEGEIGGKVGDLLGGKRDKDADVDADAPKEEGTEDKVNKGLQGLLGGKKEKDEDAEK